MVFSVSCWLSASLFLASVVRSASAGCAKRNQFESIMKVLNFDDDDDNDDDDDERKKSKKTNFSSNDTSGHDDQNAY